MTLSDISIKNPVFAWMLMVGLILFGGISFTRMGVSQLPDVDSPVINVSVSNPGAAPEVMETEIVDILESAVMTVEGVRQISSSSRQGSANITIEFDLSRDIDVAMQEVQAKVSRAQRNLPDEMDAPIITKTNPEDQPILWLALSHNDPQFSRREMMIYVQDVLKDQFTSVSGVGDVGLGGHLEPNLRVWLDGQALKRYQLTVNDVVNAIGNEHLELPSGTLEMGRKNANIRTLGEMKSVDEFKSLLINQRGGQPNYIPLPLSKVARVEEGMADVTRVARANGKPTVGLMILKQRGSNAVAVAKNVKARMEQVRKTLPPGYELNVNMDASRFIEQSVHDLTKNLILSALATALVCWLFLGSWTSTLNILLAIPTSIMGAFTILYFSGFTLNTFTLLGLSLAIGIVVDDAIMVLENIFRHQETGKHRVLAASVGAREVTFAAIATTMAIVAIFLPVAFMSGVIGRYFFQFGVTMTVAVLLSLLEALTLTPMRCSQFVTVSTRRDGFEKRVEGLFHRAAGFYGRSLAKVLDHRWKTMFGALVFFCVSLSILLVLRKEFVPSQDQSMYRVSLRTAADSSLEATDEKFKMAEAILAKRPEVLRFFGNVGGFSGSQTNQGTLFVTLKPKGQRGVDPVLGHELTQAESMAALRKELKAIPGTRVILQDMSQNAFGTSRGFPIELGVRGADWDTLAVASGRLREAMAECPLLSDVDTNYEAGMPEVDVVPDRAKATRYGVSIAAIAQTVNMTLGGQTVGQYPRGARRDDIRVRLEPDQRSRAEQIKDLFDRNNRGELVPLANLVTLKERATVQQINRADRQRTIRIYANVAKGASQTDAMAEVRRIAQKTLPPGYQAVFTGSSQTFGESFKDLGFALILGVIVAYMVLASQFNSYIDPFSVLMALPFSLTGALLALWVFGQSVNIYSFIGIILLMGIVKKNSIMLVDFTNQIRKRDKKPVREALLEAAPIRFRPILMTSFACIAAALPQAFARGEGCETQIPMAVVVFGGMFVSTLLTLYVVPCFYSLVAPWESRHAHEDLLAEVLRDEPGERR